MAKCKYCGSTIITGGVRVAGEQFCNNSCYQNAHILSGTQNIPPGELDQKINEVWLGKCPKCQGPGPIDFHKVHEVWSVVILTRWKTNTLVCCRSCATKRQLGSAALCFLCGWWG